MLNNSAVHHLLPMSAAIQEEVLHRAVQLRQHDLSQVPTVLVETCNKVIC